MSTMNRTMNLWTLGNVYIDKARNLYNAGGWMKFLQEVPSEALDA